MSAQVHVLCRYLEATLLEWNCRESTAPHAARAMVEALSFSGDLEQGWSQAVEHLAVARVLYRIEGEVLMEAFLETVYSGRMLATARALAMLDRSIHSCAALLDASVLRKHHWRYSGVAEDWTLDLDGLVRSPEGLELGLSQALKRTLDFVAPVWDASAGVGRLFLCAEWKKQERQDVELYGRSCLERLAAVRSWGNVPTLFT